jgi:Family of unknown function (DUF5683)
MMTSFCNAFSQKNDSLKTILKIDTAIVVASKKHNPKLATRRSLMLPGWGQAYNKEYWKIPIVYGALSIPTITFFYNNKYYKEAKFAYDARFKATELGGKDSTDYKTLETKYQKADINAIQSLRNAARRDRDYSIFWFGIVWLLNVADATVFGHLKDFDVSNNLSMKVHPQFNATTKTPSLSFAFTFKNKKAITSFFDR